MAKHFDALTYEGTYSFTIAFPHGRVPSENELRNLTGSADNKMELVLERMLAGYCAKVGEVSSCQTTD
jgi:hypothetical protein